MEYNYCPFCGKKEHGHRKKINWFGKTVEYFICIYCDRVQC